MEKTNEALCKELEELKQKYSTLEAKYTSEKEQFRKSEEEMHLKLLFLEGVANSTVDGFLVVNPFGQKILQNKRTVELWKIPQEVVDDPSGIKQVQHVMYMTVNPARFVGEIDYLREHPDDRTRDELELIDGTVLDRYSSPVIGADGKNYGRIWTFHDITERKKLEIQLNQSNADKDRFISILAHDLRSPFSSLLGLTQLLRAKLRTYSIEKIEKMVASIYITAQKTHELLEDTLLWANVQSNKISYCPASTNVAEVIAEVVSILEPCATSKNVAIKQAVNAELLVTLDVYMFKAILRNLVSNAIKFSKDGGKIEITVLSDSKGATVSVSDNGVGIKPEIQEKLFQSSPVVSSPGTLNETGTGLGLLLCKEFVEKHHGEIWIESSINEGTSVYFTIPETDCQDKES